MKKLLAASLLSLFLAGAALAQSIGATNIATGDVSVGTGATLVVAQRITVGASRINVTIINPTQAVSLCVGNTGVSAANGACLPAVAGASITLNTTAAIYAIWADGSTHTVSFVESY